MKKLIVITNLIVFAFFLGLPVLAADCVQGVQGQGVCNPAGEYLVDFSKPQYNGQNTFAFLFTYFIRQILLFAAVLAVFFIIFSGLQYITSGVNEEWAESGKRTLRNATIGLMIIILSYIIVNIINRALG